MESKPDQFAPSRMTITARRNAPTRENVAWGYDPYNYDRTRSPDPFELQTASQEENMALLEDIKAKESEINDLRRQIESMKRKTTTNLASPEYVFPEGF